MSRRILFTAFTVLLAVVVQTSIGADDPKSASLEARFLRGLRDRGYHDLALEYIDQLRKSADTPADLKETLDYEEGRGMLEEASTMTDLERKLVVLDKARGKLGSFADAHPTHPLTPEALAAMARILVERGHTTVSQASEFKGAEAQAKLNEARAAFTSARQAYDRASAQLKTQVDALPKFIPEDSPKRRESEQLRIAYTRSLLERALVDYEDAQTYTADASPRNQRLTEAQTAFNKIYKDYRLMLAGIHARMFEGKCMEEKGELGPAMGIYKELMEHSAPELRELQRQVQFYQIIIDGKRGDHALAVDRAADWLANNPSARRTEVGLGVQLQFAKNILAQLPQIPEKDRDEAVRKATDRLAEVVRVYSAYKAEAVELINKHKPRATQTASQIAALKYEDAMAEAEQMMSRQEWDRAITYYRQAANRADPNKETEKANRARYFMSFCYFKNNRFYEAAVVAEHLARRYPKGGLSAQATEFGMNAWVMAYNEFAHFDRENDLSRLLDIAQYTIQTWPDTDQADSARNILGEVEIGRGNYDPAAAAFESIREGSPKRNDGLVRASDAHYRHSLQLRAAGKLKEADALVKKAEELSSKALKARQAAGLANTDPAFVTNAVGLAEIYRASERPKEAIAILAPIAAAINAGPKSADTAAQSAKVLTTLLRSHIGSGEANLAIADMHALEAVSPDNESRTQLFLELTQSLKKEMESLEAKGRTQDLQRVTQAYQQFLDALANSKSGQTFQSLEWAGDAMVSIGKAKEAAVIFDKLLDTAAKDPKFVGGSPVDAPDRIFRVRFKKARSLRLSHDYSKAQELTEELAKAYPNELVVLLEKGQLAEDRAQADSTLWKESLKYWTWLANRLERGSRKGPPYFESHYHVALARFKTGDKTKAIQTLRGVMTLSPAVGTPEMKAKYLALLKQMGS
jgi:cellulose synthase operon protein C